MVLASIDEQHPGIEKLQYSLHDFAVDIATYEILPLAIVNPMAIALPWIELVVGLMLLRTGRTAVENTHGIPLLASVSPKEFRARTCQR